VALQDVARGAIEGLLAAMMWFYAVVYLFLLNRFGGIEVQTHEPANVRFFQGNKEGTETVYQSKLRSVSPYVFYTIDNVEFKIEKLAKPVVHDGNRRINSGSYKLQVIGSGMAYLELAAKIPVVADFAASDTGMTFYGEKVNE
jgi:hypothetical protein